MGLRTHADTSALAGAMAAAPEELRENKFAAYKKWSVEGEELEHHRGEQEAILQKAKDKEEADKTVQEWEAQEQTAITDFENSTLLTMALQLHIQSLQNSKIKIQRLGYDVMKLCDKSAVTVPKFKRTSSTILTNLQTAYEYIFSMDMKAWVFVHMLTPPP